MIHARHSTAETVQRALFLCVVAMAIPNTVHSAEAREQVPRTIHGYPDLQGTWTSATLTPLQRPDRFGTRQTLTEAEARAIESTESDFVANAAKPSSPDKPAPDCSRFKFGCGYNNFWIDRGSQVISLGGQKRSSILIEPANGKIPPLVPQRQQELDARRASRGQSDGPETRTLSDRCLLAFGSSSGPPMLPVLYNNHYQIVQTADTVVILIEMIHDARIIRLNSKHVPQSVRKWMGDSIGRWEGNTLVVETTNFSSQQSFYGASQHAKVIERFTRTDAGIIHYRFEIEDSTAFTSKVVGELPLNVTDETIYEYACHEGNHALPGILAGAREHERLGIESFDGGEE